MIRKDIEDSIRTFLFYYISEKDLDCAVDGYMTAIDRRGLAVFLAGVSMGKGSDTTNRVRDMLKRYVIGRAVEDFDSSICPVV